MTELQAKLPGRCTWTGRRCLQSPPWDSLEGLGAPGLPPAPASLSASCAGSGNHFDSCLIELQGGSDLHPPGPAQVLVEMELLLQFGQLPSGEVGAEATWRTQAQLGHLR